MSVCLCIRVLCCVCVCVSLCVCVCVCVCVSACVYTEVTTQAMTDYENFVRLETDVQKAKRAAKSGKKRSSCVTCFCTFVWVSFYVCVCCVGWCCFCCYGICLVLLLCCFGVRVCAHVCVCVCVCGVCVCVCGVCCTCCCCLRNSMSALGLVLRVCLSGVVVMWWEYVCVHMWCVLVLVLLCMFKQAEQQIWLLCVYLFGPACTCAFLCVQNAQLRVSFGLGVACTVVSGSRVCIPITTTNSSCTYNKSTQRLDSLI